MGTVLDPIFVLRSRVRVAPGTTGRIAFWTMVAASRDAVLDLVDKHRDTTAFDRAATLAWTQAQVQLHHVGIDPGQAGLFQRVAGHLLYAGPTTRPSSDTILRGAGGQPGLWPMGISGDLPILLLRIADLENLDIARHLLKAHAYWRMKQFAVDLVILNERACPTSRTCRSRWRPRSAQASRGQWDDDERRQGRIFVLRADLISSEARALLASVARVVLVGQRGSLADQLDRVPEPEKAVRITREPAMELAAQPAAPPLRLEFFNGLGGFAENGREYVTILGPGQATPAPWINVIANPLFGFQASAEGSGFTWSATAAKTSSRLGQTIQSAIARARSCIFAMMTSVTCGVRRRCRSATTPPPMQRDMVGATANSSMLPMASPVSSCSTFRLAI